MIIAGMAFVFVVMFFSYVKYHRYTQGLSIIISSDAEGYHQYLTALFIKNDILNQPYSFHLENGKLFNKYTYAVALLQFPFFIAAHIVALVFNLPSTGKFTPYVFGVNMAGAVYAYLGLLFLFKTFRRKYGNKVAWATTGLLFLGTNLLYYTWLEPGTSHVYAFFLISWFIYLVPGFFRHPGWKTAFFLALPLGILALMRITHVVVLVYLVLYKVNTQRDLMSNIKFLIRNLNHLFLIPLFVVLFYIPQSLYWFAATGKYIVNVYDYSLVDEGFFNWKSPKIGLVLFGSTGGWLVITPLMFLALAGIIWQIIKKRGSPWAALLITAMITYVYGSWWAPTLSASYGHRGFVDIYPILALSLAYFIYRVFQLKNKSCFYALSFISLVLVYINIRMSYLYVYLWWDMEWGWSGYFNTLREVFFIQNL